MTAHQIADKFDAVLRTWLTAEDYEKMCAENRKETDPNICHSHDFCDANVAMSQASSTYGGQIADGSLGDDDWDVIWDL